MPASPSNAAALQQERAAERRQKEKSNGKPDDNREKKGKQHSPQQTGGGKIGTVELVIILFLAGLNDLIDLVEVTGFAKLLTWLIDGGTALLLFSWAFFKFRRFPAVSATVSFVAEILPLTGFVPAWTIWVLFVYIRQVKYLGSAVQKLEPTLRAVQGDVQGLAQSAKTEAKERAREAVKKKDQ